MDPSVASITQRLQKGADPGTVFFSLLADSHRRALCRCAALRSFDRVIYDDLLRPADGPDLDALLAAGEVEPVRGVPHRYRVTASLRKAAFLDWWIAEDRVPLEAPVPAPLRDLARAVARHSLATARAVDALDQLLLGDPPAARSLFQGLYDEADKAHDLPACAALLEVLEAPTRLTLLEPQLLDLYHERRSYLAARTLWQAEYNQSERYLRRPRLERALEQTLDGRDGRVVQLLGRGGMGKTMQLRWLISRRCVLAPTRIPCACIDFDSVMLTVATRDPWLLLTDIAAQLDGQFGTAPFQDLLASYGDYRILLRRSSDASSSVEAPVRADDLDSEDVLTRFTQTLIECAGDKQVVLVFDTVEELLLRPGNEPTALVRLLRRVHDEVPQIRLVFAGREDLFKDLDEPSQLLSRRSVEVDKFDDDEQRRYLREIRRVTDRELVDAIVRQSSGTPFTVAVFADLVREDPSLTAADVERLRDPGLRYVIDRVVSRIGDKRVRWLLRFGVIPRTLTCGFVAEVLKPFLASALTDTSRGQSGNPAEQETWQPGGTTPPETETDIRNLWESLRTYAGSYSWVWVEGHNNDRIRFHPEIVDPLRALLRETDPDFRPINRAAAAYYDELAGQHPAEWPSLIREAVFHHFQAGPATGIESWRAALAEARRRGRLDWARDVADELRDGYWLKGQDGAALPRQARAQAYLELARTAADLARLEPGERAKSLWADAEDKLRSADALASTHSDVHLPEPVTTILRAHIAVSQGRPDDAVKLLQRRPGPPPPAAELAELENALGNAFEALGRPQATDYYRSAFNACDRAGEAGARRAVLSLAHERAENGRADVALRWLRRGRRWLSGEPAALAEASALGRAGVPLQAASRLYSRSGMSADAVALRAQLLSNAGQPEQAIAAATEALQVLSRSTEAAADTARILAVRGLAYAALLDFGPAMDDLLAAGDRARKRRELDAVLQRVVTLQRWAARLHEIRADVAQGTGQQESAHRSAVDAARIWGELGDDRSQVSVRESYKLGHHAAELDTAIMELRISRVTQPVTRGVRIETVARLHGGQEFSRVLSGDEVGDRPEGGRVSLRSVVDRMRHDPDAWARDLSKALPPAARALIAESSGQLDIRLVCNTREAAAMPWELVQADDRSDMPVVRLPSVSTVYRSPPADIRAENHTVALQEILRILGFFDGPPDGLMGERTRSALLSFKRSAGLPASDRADRQTWHALRREVAERPRRPVRVVVIRPGRYRELVRRRGTTASGGDLARIYRSYGMSVSVIEDPTPELLRLHAPLLREAQPDIIHLAGTVLLESGATVVDFGGDAATRSMVKGSAEADQIPVTALGDLLAAAARPAFGPVVIVDVPWPGSKSEALRALLVRNSLGHQLSALGRAIAVVATGLASPNGQEQLYKLLVGGFAKGSDPAAVVADVQRGSPDYPSWWAHLPFNSTSLFLQRAPYTLLPPGTS